MKNKKILPIVIYGNKALRKKCKTLNKCDINKTLIEQMFYTMFNANGVGLAAPQIGLNIQLFVANISLQHNVEHKIICINPTIEYPEDNYMIEKREGCLSLPGLYYSVFRYNKILIKYYDEEFKYHEEMYEDWPSRILQHETDHLFQRLYIDYVPYFSVKDNLDKILNRDFECNYKTQ